jgi:hypothetical protein
MKQFELDGFNQEVNAEINNQVYQIQFVEFEDESFFLVRQFDKVVCMIMEDKKDEWEPDCNIGKELFEKIMKWINRFYLQ